MLKQKHRRACREAITKYYDGTPGLLIDRLFGGYYSIWEIGDRLLEVVEDSGKVLIYEYAPVPEQNSMHK